MKDQCDKEQEVPPQDGPDTKLDIMQFARREMHVVKEDIREMLRVDIDDYKEKIGKRDKRIIRVALGIIAFLVGVNIWAWIGITKTLNERVTTALNAEVKRVQQAISDRLDKEFETPRIKAFIGEQAKEYTEKRARMYIDDKVSEKFKPLAVEIDSKFDDAKKQITEFQSYLSATKGNIDRDIEAMTGQMSELKQRNELMRLADRAIVQGSRKDLDKLNEFHNKSSNSDLKVTAIAEILRVKGFYVSGTRLGGVDLTYKGQDGTSLKNEQITTKDLITILKNDNDWRARGRAAELLTHRPEKAVPEALIEACGDQRLDVVKVVVAAFRSVTGHVGRDVFECDAMRTWWMANKSETLKKLKD